MIACAIGNGKPGFTETVESPADAWIDADGVETFEHTRVGKHG
ncbi:MAG: hypothetical protein OEM24_01815 [Paracoccaceae bacterium]|nr:hypothetical protein [Paracoccaceae bacterium]